jgi:hypothetical protein
MILFSVQVIHTCADVIDKDHTFCKNNFIALVIVGAISPFFGILNDYGGLKLNSSIAMASLAILGIFTAKFED